MWFMLVSFLICTEFSCVIAMGGSKVSRYSSGKWKPSHDSMDLANHTLNCVWSFMDL